MALLEANNLRDQLNVASREAEENKIEIHNEKQRVQDILEDKNSLQEIINILSKDINDIKTAVMNDKGKFVHICV